MSRRQNYSVTLPGSVRFERPNGGSASTSSVTAKIGTGTYVGVTRHKPSGSFIDPTSYILYERSVSYPVGRCYHNPIWPTVSTLGQVYTGIVGPPGGGGRFDGNYHFEAALSETSILNDNGLRNTALIAVRQKLKSTDINLGVAFGERKQTASLLGDTATRLGRSVRALRRGQTRNAMNELGISSRRREPRGSNVPQKWLELQYGWKPLLSDVYGAAAALEKRPKGDWRVTAKVTRSEKSTYAARLDPVQNGNFDAYQCDARMEKSVFARLDALPQNEAIISLVSLGVTNPLSIGWELVPWSFVVDWALPIGDWLDSLDAMLGYSYATYSSSLFVKARWVDNGLTGGGATWRIQNNFTGSKTLTYLSREASASVPLPSVPRFKDPRSLGHMANGLALLSQAFGRGRR